MHEFVFLHWDIVKDQNSCRPVTSSVVPGCLGSFAEISKRNQKWISEHTRVLRKVLHSVNRNRNLATLFMVSCSTDCVWWPNTETYSPQLPARLRNYTHCSGIHIHIFLFNYWCTLWIHPFLSNMCICFFFQNPGPDLQDSGISETEPSSGWVARWGQRCHTGQLS